MRHEHRHLHLVKLEPQSHRVARHLQHDRPGDVDREVMISRLAPEVQKVARQFQHQHAHHLYVPDPSHALAHHGHVDEGQVTLLSTGHDVHVQARPETPPEMRRFHVLQSLKNHGRVQENAFRRYPSDITSLLLKSPETTCLALGHVVDLIASLEASVEESAAPEGVVHDQAEDDGIGGEEHEGRDEDTGCVGVDQVWGALADQHCETVGRGGFEVAELFGFWEVDVLLVGHDETWKALQDGDGAL